MLGSMYNRNIVFVLKFRHKVIMVKLCPIFEGKYSIFKLHVHSALISEYWILCFSTIPKRCQIIKGAGFLKDIHVHVY